MFDHDTAHSSSRQWIERCAERLLRHHVVTADEAAELAFELLASMGTEGCPERAADDLLRMTTEV